MYMFNLTYIRVDFIENHRNLPRVTWEVRIP